ncbi:uncharacterized protein EI90DRAFT_3240386 [Cantharellus anzutake]|uniref:uncharacterized protein n=1 Tax=Cantharellus anzutake TaxID=1750568 RepID=UPI001904DC58|nr:uncharacterized protein EI90DRAFT_3240386 [Cantharellus anzutake]KAF8324707.1 hypothetical protein EI90DRAFT_3240386 [Cantharellus anzutake]
MMIWLKQSRRCPLCTAEIGPYIIHGIRSKFDYQKHFLPPLRRSPSPQTSHTPRGSDTTQFRRRRRTEVSWGVASSTRQDLENTRDELGRAIERRRHVYRNRLFAKHIASNAFTKFRPYPTPSQIASSDELQSRATAFIRRELRIWPNLDVEFFTQFVLSLLRRLDIRSEPAVRALAEFLDLSGKSYTPGAAVHNAEHFAHELYSYLRSPFKELTAYDRYVQYDETISLSSVPQQDGRISVQALWIHHR